MKWYSVKEHQPILTNCCVLLAVHNKQTGNIFLQFGEWNNGWIDWEDKEAVDEYHKEVLYFCYPDPIPKAYENLMDNK
jgi:hypothetical protein